MTETIRWLKSTCVEHVLLPVALTPGDSSSLSVEKIDVGVVEGPRSDKKIKTIKGKRK